MAPETPDSPAVSFIPTWSTRIIQYPQKLSLLLNWRHLKHAQQRKSQNPVSHMTFGRKAWHVRRTEYNYEIS